MNQCSHKSAIKELERWYLLRERNTACQFCSEFAVLHAHTHKHWQSVTQAGELQKLGPLILNGYLEKIPYSDFFMTLIWGHLLVFVHLFFFLDVNITDMASSSIKC